MAKSVYQILVEIEGDKQTKDALNSIGTAVGLTGAALTAFSVGAAKLASDYEKTLGDVAIVIDEQTGSTEDLSKAIFQLQKDTKGIINVQEAAEASAELLSSGIKGQTTILNALESSQKAAIAGQSDLNTISSAAAGVVNSYGDALGKGLTQGQKFNKVIDLILKTQIDGVVTADEYARGIGNIASLASISGVSLEELNGSIALSTEKGTQASVAINNLKSAISNITSPTAMAKDEAKRLGIEFDAARLKSVGLKQVISDIFNSENFNEASLGKLFGSTEAQSAISQLGSDLDGLTVKIDNQVNGLGTLDEAFGLVEDTVNQRVINSLNLLQAALTKIGTGVLVAVEPILSLVANLASSFANLPTPVLATIGVITGLTGVALTSTGAVLLLATSLGAVQGNLAVGLPILIKAVTGISALAASSLSASVGFKGLNLSLLATNTQMGLLVGASKKALVTLAPLLTTVAAFGGAALSVALVVDSFNKVDAAAKVNRDSLKELEKALLDIKKASEGTTPEVASTESKQAIEQLKEELGGVQGFLDKLREDNGFATSLEAGVNEATVAFGELVTKTNEVEDAARNLIGLDNSALGLSPEQIQETTAAIDAAIVSLENSKAVTDADIISRDSQIERLNGYKNTLNGVVEETDKLTGATKDTALTAEEAAKAYDDYAKRVKASVGRVEQETKNQIDSLSGSESDRINRTLQLQEDSVDQQIDLLEDLKSQSQTSAEERLNIEIEIESKKVQLNKDRIEANKQLEELYRQFLRDGLEREKIDFELAQLANAQTLEESYGARKSLIEENFNLEKSFLDTKLENVAANSAEERALLTEVANLQLTKEQELAALDEELHQERLTRIQERTQAEQDRLNLVVQGQEIESQIVSNSNQVLDSQASILGKISGLLEGDNATLAQRQELLSLAEQITDQTFVTNGESSALEQAQVAIQQQLATIEIQKLDLKIKQLEIDKESLIVANQIKQLEIQGQRDLIAADLNSGKLNSADRANLQNRDKTLESQASLENRKTALGTEGIDSQLGFASLERQLASILANTGNGTGLNSTVGQLEQRALASGSISEVQQARSNDQITAEEYQRIFDKLTEQQEKQSNELKESTKASQKTSDNTSKLNSAQDQTNTQISGNTEEIKNVSGSIGSLVQISQNQLQVQTRMSARLDQISRQLDTLPGNIASRLPRPSPEVNTRR